MSIKDRIGKLERFVEPDRKGGTIIFIKSMDHKELGMKMQEAGEKGYRGLVVLPRKMTAEEWSERVRDLEGTY